MSTARLLRTPTVPPLPGDVRAPADDTPQLEGYARSRGLDHTAEGLLPGVTPALRRGRGAGAHRSILSKTGAGFFDDWEFQRSRKRPERRTSEICSGVLPGGALGLVGYQAHLERRTRGDADSTSHYWAAVQKTIVFVDLDELAGIVAQVDAGKRYEAKALLTIGRSEASSNPVETMVAPPVTHETRGETTWTFTPAEDSATVDAIVRRATHALTYAPPGVEIELEYGYLCVWAHNALEEDAQLDALCHVASSVVEGLKECALRHAPLDPDASVGAPEQTHRRRWLDDGAATVAWAEPPTDFRTAVDAYRAVTAGRGRRIGWTVALVTFGVLFGLLALAVYVLNRFELGPTGFTGTTVGAGLFFAWFALKLLRSMIGAGREMSSDLRDERAIPWGLTAYVRGYAQTRGLRQEEQAELRRRFLSPLRGRPTVALHGALPGDVHGHLAYWYEPLADEGSRVWAMAIVAAPAGPIAEPPAPYVATVAGDLLVVAQEVVPQDRTAADLDGVASTAATLVRSAAPAPVAA